MTRFVVYDWRSNKGFWRAENKGYTHDIDEAGIYTPLGLPTWAGDCWVAIPYDSALEVQARLTSLYWMKKGEESRGEDW